WLESAPARRRDAPAFYLSAGVHGDEAGAAWGLLAWARENAAWLSAHPAVLLPCLNPRGLAANTRADHRGLDLNRRFHLEDDDLSGPWRSLVRARSWRLALCLHEDYDAQGIYVYELGAHQGIHSRVLLENAARILPADPRRRIDGSVARGGVIRRRRLPLHLPGLPEAVVLHQLGCPLTLTFETPSEFGLDDRVRAHAAFIPAALAGA
ncbi:MAG TPA: M14 family metallocarboxypeptidase, partial [Prosthecobacter sp.]|nr:M14 family metallocarboxypeptidase [Prosthecobacter sp.]